LEDKPLSYHIAYWITALLPVIIGFTVTIVAVKLFEKYYKGPDDDQENDKK
jgi:hypothetical protein